MLGAVYVAKSSTEFPPADCVVTRVKVPQELPLQPGPLSAQASAVLGFEPGTGVNVATIVAVPRAGTLDGAESCNEKLLVMVTAAEICFEESATFRSRPPFRNRWCKPHRRGSSVSLCPDARCSSPWLERLAPRRVPRLRNSASS